MQPLTNTISSHTSGVGVRTGQQQTSCALSQFSEMVLGVLCLVWLVICEESDESSWYAI